jgi:hypothetical protein
MHYSLLRVKIFHFYSPPSCSYCQNYITQRYHSLYLWPLLPKKKGIPRTQPIASNWQWAVLSFPHTSRRAPLSVVSYPILEWLNELKETYVSNPVTQELVKKVHEGLLYKPKFVLRNGILLYKKMAYVGESLKNKGLSFVHASPIARHVGFDKTMQRARKDFVWPGMKSDVKKFIKEYDVYQRVKAENLSPAGLLQSLPIPNRPWSSISMDFIKGLPLSQGYSVVWVVVDRLTKYGHFIPLKHHFTAEKLAQIFMTELFKLHGMPLNIVSNRDSTFTSRFWTKIFKLQGVFLAFSTA